MVCCRFEVVRRWFGVVWWRFGVVWGVSMDRADCIMFFKD